MAASGNTRLLCQAREIGDRTHVHLPHHAGAVNLDGLLDNAEIAGDLLVQPAGHDVAEHLALARRQTL